jgi:S-formylglutathione hydrolase
MNGSWTRVAIAGKQADVYDPPGGRARFGVLFLHPVGLETLTDRPAFTNVFAELGLACVCPLGGRCWWADRVCAEFDPRITPERYLLDAVVPYFRTRWGLEPRALAIQGVSMGGQGALRLAFKHPDTFPAIGAIAPAVDHYELYGRGTALDEMYDSKEQCRQDSAPMHVHPVHQPPHVFFCIDPDDRDWFRGCDRLHEKLSALGVAHETDFTTRAGAHTWAYFSHVAPRVLRFVTAGLEQEGRRLL